MCTSEIVLYPDIILRTQAQDVIDVTDQLVLEVITSLQKTMDTSHHCVGLAANQIGSNLNIFVADSSKNKRGNSEYGNIVMINPKVVSISHEDSQILREGCMSIPDLTGNVNRSTNIQIEYIDEHGIVQTIQAVDFEARVFQHEIDHLLGKVFLDRVKSSRDVFARKSYR